MRVHHVHIEHRFAKPPQAIFTHLAEHENLAEVFGAQIKRLSDGQDGERNGVGSVRQLKIGPLAPFEETVTEFVPFQRIAYMITKGSPIRDHLGVMTFAPADGGTQFVYDIRLGSAVPGLALIVSKSLTRSISQALPLVEQKA